MYFFIRLLATLLLCPALSHAESAHRLLCSGEWFLHSQASSGEPYLGLFFNNEKLELKPGKLLISSGEIATIVDFKTIDSRDSRGTNETPLYLLRGDDIEPGIVSGRILRDESYFKRPGDILDIDENNHLLLTGNVFVDNTFNDQPHSFMVHKDVCVVLVTDNPKLKTRVSQELFCVEKIGGAVESYPENAPPDYPSVEFVGDLNKDGYPDVIVNGSSHGMTFKKHLFLSGHIANEPGKLKKVAEFHASSC